MTLDKKKQKVPQGIYHAVKRYDPLRAARREQPHRECCWSGAADRFVAGSGRDCFRSISWAWAFPSITTL